MERLLKGSKDFTFLQYSIISASLALSFTRSKEASTREGGLSSFSIEMLTERFNRSRAPLWKGIRAFPKAVEKLSSQL